MADTDPYLLGRGAKVHRNVTIFILIYQHQAFPTPKHGRFPFVSHFVVLKIRKADGV